MNDYLSTGNSANTLEAPTNGADTLGLTSTNTKTSLKTRVQAFEAAHFIGDKDREETEFHPFLLEWASRLPKSSLGFIDVAAGAGFEARLLANNGYPCIAQDPSEEVARISKHQVTRVGKAEELEFKDASFSGVLMKDSWMFLSPEQKQIFMTEAFRVLVPGGSVLLQSQREDAHRAWYMPNKSDIIQKLSSFDFLKYGDSWYEKWLEAVVDLQKEGEIYIIEYSCMPNDTENLANQAGLLRKNLTEYGWNHPLAVKNRWERSGGFIIELQKP
ncbi:MAG: class I SAM-dependent methyltransferase [Candidatus Daviesbacteria bacterium]|nr:class I SAM-dependent methyltransferase [Candidatus Daviesbacteria bacterium]